MPTKKAHSGHAGVHKDEEQENEIETYHDHPVGCSLASNPCEEMK